MEQTKRLGSLQKVCERLDAAVAALDEQIIVHAWDTASASLLAELEAAKYWLTDYRKTFAAYAAEVQA